MSSNCFKARSDAIDDTNDDVLTSSLSWFYAIANFLLRFDDSPRDIKFKTPSLPNVCMFLLTIFKGHLFRDTQANWSDMISET